MSVIIDLNSSILSVGPVVSNDADICLMLLTLLNGATHHTVLTANPTDLGCVLINNKWLIDLQMICWCVVKK